MSTDTTTKPGRDSQVEDALDRQRTVERIMTNPAIFEQLYLAPHSQVKGQLRQTYGNPSPVALAGFIMCTTPASMALLGWKGAGGFMAAANVGTYFSFGGLLLLLGGIGEWILGNTFPATVFSTFGAFWFTFGITLGPENGAFGTYSTTTNPADGLDNGQFYATFAYFLIAMAILCAIYLVASIRTNIIFFAIFLLLVPTFGCLAASFFAVSENMPARAETLQHAGAAQLFVISLLGWYIFFAQILMAVEFPFCLPLGDLSTLVPSIRSAGRVENSKGEKAV